MIGKTLGHYEIIEPLGAGGMGEVYRARDRKLDRDVAIKVLPDDFATDPERLARLEREAKLLAALNHPNIATIHALDEKEGARFLVLELVKGESLERVLAKGRLPVERALDVCKQIAGALETAHNEGIIHRDLKPANVLLTAEGRPKVLDFGIAKSVRVDAENAATAKKTNLTVAGTLVGTPSYMSPEQVRGEAIDKGVDIWSFGCLLFEVLTAKSAFAKETMADTLAAIVDQDPEWSALPDETPHQVRHLIKRCLRKDADRRLRDIGDAKIEIDDSLREPARETGRTTEEPLAGAHSRLPWSTIAATITVALVAATLAWILKPEPRPEVLRFPLTGASGVPLLWSGFHSDVAISPGGRYVVYYATIEGQAGLYRRGLDQLEGFTLLAGMAAHDAFFSPDGEWIAFEHPSNAPELRKVPLAGGPVETIGPLPNTTFTGGSWGPNDTIVFGSETTGLMSMPAGGGEPTELTTRAAGESHMWPEFLPDGRSVLFTIRRGNEPDESHIAILDLETDEIVELLPGTRPRYIEATGHLVFGYGNSGFPTRSSLHAVAFDARRRAPLGDAVRLLDGLVTSPRSGVPLYAVADNGSLVYVVGETEASERSLALVDHVRGGVQTLDLPAAHYLHPRVSPDGASIVYQTINAAGRGDIWVYDLDGDTAPRKLTLEGNNIRPIWTPDGNRVTYASDRDGTMSIHWQPVDGGGSSQPLTTAAEGESHWPDSWSIDDVLSFTLLRGADYDIWTLRLGDEDGPQPFAAEPSVLQIGSAFSPDGKWIAYSSTPGREWGTFVQPYPATGDEFELAMGGVFPQWSATGGEMFFRSVSNVRPSRVKAIEVANGFERGPERTLSVESFVPTANYRDFDPMPDGEHLIAVIENPEAGPAVLELNIVLNWFEDLKRLVPAGGSR